MAKKPHVPAAPAITALPISGGDSPLIIDLPDGQKLIVGNLPAGSVIEVATWRGTGRPDSRTSRLMLGMSSGQESSPQSATPENKKSLAPIFVSVKNLYHSLRKKASSLLGTGNGKSNEKKNSLPLIEKVTPAAKSSDAEDIDDWLNSILEKSAKNPAPVTPAKKAVKKSTAKKPASKKPTTRRA